MLGADDGIVGFLQRKFLVKKPLKAAQLKPISDFWLNLRVYLLQLFILRGNGTKMFYHFYEIML